MKGMFLKKCDIYYQKCATVAQRFQLSMTKLGACDEIRWNDGTSDWTVWPLSIARLVPRTDDEGRPKSTTGTSDQTKDGPATKLGHRPKDKIIIRPVSKDKCFGPWGMTG